MNQDGFRIIKEGLSSIASSIEPMSQVGVVINQVVIVPRDGIHFGQLLTSLKELGFSEGAQRVDGRPVLRYSHTVGFDRHVFVDTNSLYDTSDIGED